MNKLNNKPNLATKNAQDFFIGEDGSRYISQKRLAALCGVSQQAISLFIEKEASLHTQATDNKGEIAKNGKSACSLPKKWSKMAVDTETATNALAHYSMVSKAANDTARRNALELMMIGIEVYIDQQAGFKIISQSDDAQFEMAELQLELAAISDRQPHHKDSLAGITGKKRHEVKSDYDYLCSVGLLTREPVYSRSYVYQPTDKAIKMGLVTGAKQKTLLFSQKIIRILKYQLALPI